ncbi:MAG TPA: MaoC/PaaZ C-terminal domain-containing protein [Nocardioidaceae bacterium]|nr:MaoC/PaaZ C-terminal domain-containing protein [Nocardioidaceae bacterium]
MPTRTLDGPPATAPLYLKAALPAVPLVGRLPGIRHDRGDLPDTVLARERISTDGANLAAYADVCGFPLRNALPVTYPHMAAFGLQMALMTDASFPFAPMGLVHLTNSITQYVPIDVTDEYALTVQAANLRPHPRGRLVDLVSRATVDGTLVWEETSSYLARGRRDDSVAVDSPVSDVEVPTGSTLWKLRGDLGRRYGAVSGDRNPIHLYALSAKAFGFPRQIAHGLWTKARCLAALESRLDEAYRVDVEFKKPILLPGSVVFASRFADDVTFGVTSTDGASTHLVGRITAV